MIRYTAEGTQGNFEEMVRFLAKFPKVLDLYASKGMTRTVSATGSHIMPRIPVRTGAAKGAFFKDVLGFGGSLTGLVGFKGGKGAPYHINIVEYGARPHSLVGGSKQRTQSAYSRFEKRASKGKLSGTHVNINGTWVTVVKHPGFSARGFMAAGLSAAQPIYNREMQQAVDDAFKEITSS